MAGYGQSGKPGRQRGDGRVEPDGLCHRRLPSRGDAVSVALVAQPDGFEGFLGIEVAPNVNYLAIPESDEVGPRRIDVDTTFRATPTHLAQGEDFIAEIP